MSYAAAEFVTLQDLYMVIGPNHVESNYDRITYTQEEPGNDQKIILHHIAEKRGGGMMYNKGTGEFITYFLQGCLSSPDREQFNNLIDTWLFFYQRGHVLQYGAASQRELGGGAKGKKVRSKRKSLIKN
jgi:hypothetical protein